MCHSKNKWKLLLSSVGNCLIEVHLLTSWGQDLPFPRLLLIPFSLLPWHPVLGLKSSPYSWLQILLTFIYTLLNCRFIPSNNEAGKPPTLFNTLICYCHKKYNSYFKHTLQDNARDSQNLHLFSNAI